jgi:antitoxin (DNA-binding transcriptional repressor) of toxin-antitoxin stability system
MGGKHELAPPLLAADFLHHALCDESVIEIVFRLIEHERTFGFEQEQIQQRGGFLTVESWSSFRHSGGAFSGPTFSSMSVRCGSSSSSICMGRSDPAFARREAVDIGQPFFLGRDLRQPLELHPRETQLLDWVEAGEDVIITRRGRPAARLTSPSANFDQQRSRAAVVRIKERRKGQKLDGLPISELIGRSGS